MSLQASRHNLRITGWLVGFFLVSAPGVATLLAASPWGVLSSDVPADPALATGTLENGLRYAVLRHPYPANRVSVRLLVASGSRDERNEERGIAHFVEHMAFRGTRTYPKGSLVGALQLIGIAPGPDSSAFTSYDNTVYTLELPDSTAATLQLGLNVLRDFADGITFDADTFNLERVVVLNEKSFRDTSSAREQEANRTFLWPTSREVHRSPIGLAATINAFTREQLIAFYDTWYRPERMAVIVAGDISAADAIELIRKDFSSLAARKPPPPEPEALFAEAANPEHIDVYREENSNGAALVIETPYKSPAAADTPEQRARAVHQQVVMGMFQNRLRRASIAPGSGVATSGASIDGPVRDWGVVSLSASTTAKEWPLAAALLEQELRRVLTFGFTEGELKEVKASLSAAYIQAVRTADTRYSGSLAAQLADCLLNGTQFATPAAMQDAYAPVLAATTLDDCNASFRAVWKDVTPHVFVAAGTDFIGDAAEVDRVLSLSRKTEVKPPPEYKPAVFAYSDFGKAGTLERHQRDNALNLDLAEMSNGVRLNFKPTNFDEGHVLVSVHVGYGKQTMPIRGLDLFADAAFLGGGLVKHSAEELAAITAGRDFNLNFGIENDSATFTARSSREDLRMCLALIAAYMTDPGFRPEGVRTAQASLSNMFSQIGNSPSGLIMANLEWYLTGGDSRFGVPDPREAYLRTYQELEAWLAPQLKLAPVEVGIVGDITWDEANEATSSTIGALPKRQARRLIEARQIFFATQPLIRTMTNGPAIRQGSFAIAIPAPNVFDAERERRCTMLAALINEEVRNTLRVELGATYTPTAMFVRNNGLEGFSYFLVSADVLSAHVERAVPVVIRALENLRDKGISPDLFQRVQQPLLRAIQDETRFNDYWLRSVVGVAQQYPNFVAAAHSRASDYAAITPEELQALARQYFTPGNIHGFLAFPAAPEPPKP